MIENNTEKKSLVELTFYPQATKSLGVQTIADTLTVAEIKNVFSKLRTILIIKIELGQRISL